MKLRPRQRLNASPYTFQLLFDSQFQEKSLYHTYKILDWINKHHIFPIEDEQLIKDLIKHMQIMVFWEEETSSSSYSFRFFFV